ncbi:MAG TPA: sulfatase-like hydrolase/transferase [Chitinophagales bacterium]|nr:sulfatase-like hydrolase/transferase [Chitinophagales bacterium]
MKGLFTFFLSVFIFNFSAHSTCSLPAPGGFNSQNIAACQFGIKWNAVSGASYYTVQYKLSSDITWTIISNAGDVTSYIITGVGASSSYNVKVAAVCPSNEAGAYTTAITVSTPSCSQPTGVAISAITATSAVVSWSVPCSESNFKLNYRLDGGTWIIVNGINTTSYTLTNLASDSVYNVKVESKCSNGTHSTFSTTVSFTTLPVIQTNPILAGKNVLLVIIDDARFDTYAANNGPAFFADTNISRIANEGVNFKMSFPAQSQCAPSRACITTGTYPHINGIKNNPYKYISDTILLPTLPEILHDNGYYTGLIGKYHISNFPQPGYDYWMECHHSDYIDVTYNVNGDDKKIFGHQTDVVTDSALGFLQRASEKGKRFFLWLAYRAPHTPYTPRPQDEGLFDNDIMPLPNNFEPYSENYPAFLYDCHDAPDSAHMVDDWRGYFESLNGVNTDIGKVWDKLTTLGLMDSTLIIFMSDNGYLMGEHHMLEKMLAYEPSIKIPIFMRYPKLIKPGKVVKKQMAMNIDIAPTILDFAGIPQTFGMQGVSLFKLMKNSVKRTTLLYEWNHQDCVPDMRAIRTFSGKYIQYYCNDTTEEFFDLNADPKENINQIFNDAYADSVQLYRDKMVYWRNYYADYSYDSIYTCNLWNIVQRSPQDINEPFTFINVFPNPAHDHFTIHFMSSDPAATTIRILNAIGIVVYEETLCDEEVEISRGISTENFAGGNYFAVVQHGANTYEKVFVVQ